MDYEDITTDAAAGGLLPGNWPPPRPIAFDTEFVSEHTYRPVLCLVQVAAEGRLTVIDAMTVGDMKPFGRRRSPAATRPLVHAGRGEMEFCLQAVGSPARAALRRAGGGRAGGVGVSGGLQHPGPEDPRPALGQARDPHRLAAATALEAADRIRPGRRPPLAAALRRAGGEARRTGPAGLDGSGNGRLEGKLRRAVSRTVGGGSRAAPPWTPAARPLSASCGGGGMPRPSRRDQPARRVLRDDLIIELARRQTADAKRIRAVRGMERGDLVRRVGEIAAAIQRALAAAGSNARRGPAGTPPQLSVLGQFLFAALGSICRQARALAEPGGRAQRHPRTSWPIAAAGRARAAARGWPAAGARSLSAVCSRTCWRARWRSASSSRSPTIRCCSRNRPGEGIGD